MSGADKGQLARFQTKVRDYYRHFGRDLAWRRDITPYRVVVSEIMLQQTQVSRVENYFERWIAKFGSFSVLAGSSERDVIGAWQGLGYNRRALWLLRIAREVERNYDGQLPHEVDTLVKLPGIGPNTVGSIAVFAWQVPAVFIETNIRRVLIHEFFPGVPDVHDRDILPIVEASLDRDNPREWYWALMDYGSYLGSLNPNANRRSAHYGRQSVFAGSNRQLRGQVLRDLVAGAKAREELGRDGRLDAVLSQLEKEGFIQRSDGRYHIAGQLPEGRA